MGDYIKRLECPLQNGEQTKPREKKGLRLHHELRRVKNQEDTNGEWDWGRK
jgi:hypothetical protein